jgi:hypothetical protein
MDDFAAKPLSRMHVSVNDKLAPSGNEFGLMDNAIEAVPYT